MNNTRVYLALKHAPPRGFWKRAFHALTAARLVTRYPHGGIVICDQLMHSNFSKGLHREEFIPDGWDLWNIPAEKEAEVWALFSELEGTPYDTFGLLAFVLPWRVSDSSRMYCFKWQMRVLRLIFNLPGDSRQRITPEDLLALIARDQ